MFTTHRADRRRGSRRSVVLAPNAMVCTSQPLASAAGAQVLREGGSAIDAAVAAAAVLAVVEPYSTGIGGDCFLLYWCAEEGRLYGLNGSGRAPAAATREAVLAGGHSRMPALDVLSVTVPGAVDAWATALDRFGRRPLSRNLEAAIEYADNGFPVSEVIAFEWSLAAGFLHDEEARRVFLPGGHPPAAGDVVRFPDLARSLRALAQGGPDAFYRGELAQRIVARVREGGGLLDREDLDAHCSTWVDPISTTYRGHEVCEVPPNTQGVAALLGLNILEQFEEGVVEPDSPDAWHLRIEAVKLAYADRDRHIADPEQADVPLARLLSKDYAQGRAALIRRDRALPGAAPGAVDAGAETVYLTTADPEGNVCSFIQSLFYPFGCGVVVPGTGIALHNRGLGFSLDPTHPNCLAPRKRPFHTLLPAMILRAGRPLVSFGVMGGDMQAQAHVQVVSNLVDWADNVQEALDRPRFHFLGGAEVALEHRLERRVGEELRARGHSLREETAALLRGGFGGGQAIAIDPTSGVLWGGSDERKDGAAIGF